MSEKSIDKKALLSALLSIFVIISLMPTFAARAENSLNIVQVQIIPQNSNVTDYSINIYNSSGTLVAQAHGKYPIFSFGLPQGKYLITASASSNYNEMIATTYPFQTFLSQPYLNQSITSIVPVLPPRFLYYYQEDGYSLIDVNSSTNLTIFTKQLDKIPLYKLSITVRFLDNSPVANADVYANPVLAVPYYWWNVINQSEAKMGGQTDDNGQVQLIVPELPLIVTSWKWITVKPPLNMTNIKISVGGEDINLTLYYSPTTIGFTGNALVIPPQDTATITLHYQPQEFWVYNYAAPLPSPLESIIQQSSGQSQGLPSSLYQALQSDQAMQSIPSFQTAQLNQHGSSNQSYSWMIALAAALAIALAGSLLVLRRVK